MGCYYYQPIRTRSRKILGSWYGPCRSSLEQKPNIPPRDNFFLVSTGRIRFVECRWARNYYLQYFRDSSFYQLASRGSCHAVSAIFPILHTLIDGISSFQKFTINYVISSPQAKPAVHLYLNLTHSNIPTHTTTLYENYCLDYPRGVPLPQPGSIRYY